MSEKIVADNLDAVVYKNREIHEDIMEHILAIRANWQWMQTGSVSQLAMQILKSYGLIQLPLDNQYWSGAIFVKNEKRIPVINTALPRANQYFTAWHEIYHLMFDQVSFSHVIESETVMEERKAEYFASLMLLGNLLAYYSKLPEMDFLSKVFHCMDAFQVPYKAVLIALYEGALQNRDQAVMKAVRDNFDRGFPDLASRFRALGLDDSLVKPSYVINVGVLHAKIQKKITDDPELNCNYDNAAFLENVLREINLMMRDENV